VSSVQRQARKAGLLYLLMAVVAPIGLLYVPGRVFVAGDPITTAANVRASEALLRIGIVSELLHQTLAIFLVLALYRLFKPVDESHARLMVVLGALLSVPIVFVNVLNEIAALALAAGVEIQKLVEPSLLDALIYLFLQLHGQGIVVASIFWGLWLFPFGWLVIRCGFIPRVLGVLLFIAGAAYVISAVTTLALPRHTLMVSRFISPLVAAELPIIIWLLIWGAKRPAGDRPAAPGVREDMPGTA
jgi:hypothetical protein